MPARTALITGISGQDGSYLADLLLAEGYEVTGMIRPGNGRGEFTPEGVGIVTGELLEPESLRRAVADVAPDELYHLAAPTFVPDSWKDPTETMQAIAGSTATLLAIAAAEMPGMRMFFACSSEIFGEAGVSPQDEMTPTRPRTPYGVAKLAAHGLVRTMRERHGLFAVSGILYNHESPRRPEHFLPRKVTRGAAAIAAGQAESLELGDLRAVRDWSHAADIMRGARLALQAPEPADYVFASGVAHTVGDLVDTAFAAVGLEPAGYVHVNPEFVREPEATPPVGDPSRARQVLGWEPEHTFEDLIGEMVAADVAALGGS